MTLSVKSFKRIIVVLLALLILVPTILAIHFGQKSARLEKQLAEAGLQPSQPGQQEQPGGQGTQAELLTPEAEAIDYQTLFPDLYGEELPAQREKASKTVYLTFDTSLNSNTVRVMEILERYGVKATFFVKGSDSSDAVINLDRLAKAGHAVGLSSYSDSYQEIYQSVGAYLADFAKADEFVFKATGAHSQIFRFPGGSVNAYNSGIYRELNSEMLRRNYVFFDWNVSGEDTQLSSQSADQIREKVIAGVEQRDRSIVRLQDGVGKESVVDALPGIIETLQARGYDLQPLSAEVLPVVFSYQSAP